MGYYRNGMGPDDPNEGEKPKIEKLELNSFEELPEGEYNELIARSLAMNNRLQERQKKLHKIMNQEVGDFSNSEHDMEETYWRTAAMEQLAFFELQIVNIHKILETLIDKNK